MKNQSGPQTILIVEILLARVFFLFSIIQRVHAPFVALILEGAIFVTSVRFVTKVKKQTRTLMHSEKQIFLS